MTFVSLSRRMGIRLCSSPLGRGTPLRLSCS